MVCDLRFAHQKRNGGNCDHDGTLLIKTERGCALARLEMCFYRSHRIVAVQLDGTWHVVLHGYTGAIARTSITSTSLADAMAQAERLVEARLGFRQPSRGEQAT